MKTHHKTYTLGFVALGSNLPRGRGDPAQILRDAVDWLTARDDVQVHQQSRMYQSPAWPPGNGPDFVNGVIAVSSTLTALALLDVLHAAERRFDRERPERWAPRTLDLDLLAYGAQVYPDAAEVTRWMDLPPAEQARQTPGQLILPHPRLHDRGFVLIPWADIAPDWRHPVTGQTVRQMQQALPPVALDGIVPLCD